MVTDSNTLNRVIFDYIIWNISFHYLPLTVHQDKEKRVLIYNGVDFMIRNVP